MVEDDFFPDEPDEAGPPSAEAGGDPWNVLIVDDEPGIHQVTRLALGGIRFQGRPVEFLSAYSGREGLALLSARMDIALILLDVVMESDHAGLDLARAVREELHNHQVRIILRTGQPGVAPERQVIEAYDINDYKAKTELTRDKLYTALIGTLRSYADIVTIEQSRRMIEAHRQGLLKVIEASSAIFRLQTVPLFAQGVLEQLNALIFTDDEAVFARGGGLAALSLAAPLNVVAATGHYAGSNDRELRSVVAPPLAATIDRALAERRSIRASDHFVGFVQGRGEEANLLVIDGPVHLSAADASLLELFCRNVGIGYENLLLRGEVEQTQRDIIYRLGEVVETRSKETGNHVRRLAEYSYILGRALGLDEIEAEILRTASPMHDIGKVGIPDSILNKPGPLTPEERSVMQTHAAIGWQMLRDARPRILQAAAVIAHEHHEKWNGSGYPRGLAGDAIHLFGRITALVDVFDALASERVYKKAWELPRVLDLLRSERGQHFDPAVVDAFFGVLDQIEAIRGRYSDAAAPAG
ncbi:transcriptional regulator [Allostella sp. ATCC 35155]|nr:transcriptional regulator [Stella sp. ATCC 35155]